MDPPKDKKSHCLYCLRQIPFLLNGKPWLFCSPNHNPFYTNGHLFRGEGELMSKIDDIMLLIKQYKSEFDMPNQNGRYILAPETYKLLFKKAFNSIKRLFLVEKRYLILREKLTAEHGEGLLDAHYKVINIILEQLRSHLNRMDSESWLKTEDSHFNLRIGEEYFLLPTNSSAVYTSLDDDLWENDIFPPLDLSSDSDSNSEYEEEEEEAIMNMEDERHQKSYDSEETRDDRIIEPEKRGEEEEEEEESEDEFNMTWPESKIHTKSKSI